MLAAGCVNNPYTLQGQLQGSQQQQATLAQRNQELQARATTLDRDNQELEALLAQSKQQSRILEDQLTAMREQLGSVTSQLAKSRLDGETTARKAETLAASVKRRAGATITPNNSLQAQLPALSIPGVEVRADGDVIRIELPGGRLFEPGGARLNPNGVTLIDQVAAEIQRSYPNQMIGVEGHTDTDPITNGKWANNHQLSIGRAMAVYDQLLTRSRIPPNRLFIVGHGSNHPVVANATPEGKERNRRVELVIYPDRVAAR
jgi:flagellar motor protein MotB